MQKNLGLAVAAVLAVAAIALWTLLARFEPSIKSTIETEGALATQTQVLVGSVVFPPLTGVGTLDGLTVGNPTGFSSPYAVVVDRIALQVESGSLLGGGPVIVDSATVIAPQITYKAQSPTATSNLETIKNNAQAYSATPAAIRAGSNARKVIIRNLTFMGGTLSLDIHLPGGALTVPLPPLHLVDIGATTNGATPPEIIRAVCEALAEGAKKAVTEAIAQKLKSGIDMLKPPVDGLPKLPSPPSLPSLPRPPSPPALPPPPGLPLSPSPGV
ncbi:hypothetical protein B0G81_7680 [Paraburkholderia sp. BL6665CI2N2]|uniref:hypothetical protein n=1 Tax=Paraburkholderia sp. BL6665CI2N2 TaxID=1938806 RepID=UPI001064D82F|nr:hypothetical protein [Paraburkholderia sp. BL6665CI2N2]TDY27133.1 hypothetical protein B0G81_7680 [Paraburkholderia sp. BL6665CI2N2]